MATIKNSELAIIDRHVKLNDSRYTSDCSTAIDASGYVTIVDEDNDDAVVATLAHYTEILPVALITCREESERNQASEDALNGGF